MQFVTEANNYKKFIKDNQGLFEKTKPILFEDFIFMWSHLSDFGCNVVSSNPVHGKVYSIQYYVIKFVSDLQQVGGMKIIII
jgi:hypothetical protein